MVTAMVGVVRFVEIDQNVATRIPCLLALDLFSLFWVVLSDSVCLSFNVFNLIACVLFIALLELNLHCCKC